MSDRKTSTSAVINLYDVTAKLDGYYESNSAQPFVDLTLLDEERTGTIKYATLENRGFLLDGSFSIMDENNLLPENFAYWSNSLSNELGRFDVNPIITREFNESHSAAGLSLMFDRNYLLPKRLRIMFKDVYDNVIADKEFVITSYSFFASMIVEDFRYMQFEFIEVEPYSFARVKGIVYGLRLEYSSESDKNLSKASVLEEIDITGNAVSINTSALTVIDEDETFNINNPQGYYSLLQQKQKIEIFSVVDGVEYQMASHYMKSWETASGVVATFSCQDILGVMSDTSYKGNLFDEVSARDIIADILNDFGWSDYYVDDEIGDIILSGIIAPMNHKDALQQVVFACEGIVDTTRSGEINIYRPLQSIQTSVLSDRKFMNPKHTITQTDLITDVLVTAHNYVKAENKTQAYKAVVDAGTYEMSFNTPYSDFEGNCTILESGYFYLRFKVDEPTEVIIMAYKYEDFQSTFREALQELPAGSYRKERTVEKCTLISKSNARSVAKNLYKFYQYRLNHEFKFIMQDEKVGNFSAVSIKNGLSSVVFNSLDINLTGGFLASAKGIGHSLRGGDFYYTTEIYANDDIGVM